LSRLGATLLARQNRRGASTPPGSLLGHIVSNSMLLPTSLNESLRNHAFKIVHNLLGVKARIKDQTEVADTNCSLCGDEYETMEHLFCDCVAAKGAVKALRARPEKQFQEAAETLAKASGADFLLQTGGFDGKGLVVLLVFSKAVWRARWRCSGKGVFSLGYVAGHIADNFVSFYRCRFQWSFRNRELEKMVFHKLLSTLSEDQLHIYTDGSSFGNPGPAGASFVAYHRSSLIKQGSKGLGIATNGYAEVSAILLAVRWLYSNQSNHAAYIFVDNRRAINLATGSDSPAWCADEVKEIRRLLKIVSTGRRVAFYWVPGHAGIAGNEAADKLAKKAAKARTHSSDFFPRAGGLSRPGPAEGPGLQPSCRRPSSLQLPATSSRSASLETKLAAPLGRYAAAAPQQAAPSRGGAADVDCSRWRDGVTGGGYTVSLLSPRPSGKFWMWTPLLGRLSPPSGALVAWRAVPLGAVTRRLPKQGGPTRTLIARADGDTGPIVERARRRTTLLALFRLARPVTPAW